MREAVKAAKREERRKKQQYAVRRHHPGYRWSMFQHQAKTRGIEVTLRRIDFERLIGRPCFYCGLRERIGIDRVSSDAGYSKDNVVPCCATCNFMKGTLGLREFVGQAQRVAGSAGAITRSLSSPN